jgi:hypothetical protein
MKSNGSINAKVIAYIEQFFNCFSREVGEQTPDGLSIEKSGVIVVVESRDVDFSNLVYLPSILNSVPEQVNVITFTGEDGKQREILHGLFLTNNEFGVDLIALKDELHGELAEKLNREVVEKT